MALERAAPGDAMYDHSLFLRTVSELGGRLLAPYDLDTVLSDLAERLVEVFDLAGAGLVLAEDDGPGSAVGSPAGVAAVEELQSRHRAGPCVEALRAGEVLVIHDLDEYADRWPEYCEAVGRDGLASCAAVPLRLGDHVVGVLDLYAGRREWTTADLEAAVVLAEIVTAFLVGAARLRRQEQLAEQLQGALDSRTVIEQAKGVIAARSDITVDEAFERIRRHARTHHVTVRAVSDAIVNLGLRI